MYGSSAAQGTICFPRPALDLYLRAVCMTRVRRLCYSMYVIPLRTWLLRAWPRFFFDFKNFRHDFPSAQFLRRGAFPKYQQDLAVINKSLNLVISFKRTWNIVVYITGSLSTGARLGTSNMWAQFVEKRDYTIKYDTIVWYCCCLDVHACTLLLLCTWYSV